MQTGTRNRGFASMDRERQREIARKGGRAAHQKGTAHEFTTDEARAAGRKGGERVSADRDHMSRIGRLGGKHSAGRRAARGGQGQDQGNNGNANAQSTSEANTEMAEQMSTAEAGNGATSENDDASEE